MDDARFAELRALVSRPDVGEETSRLAREAREGRTGPLDWPARQRATTPEPPAEVSFAGRAARIEAAQGEHWARRRRAEQVTASSERLYARFRDLYGPEKADRLMAGQFGGDAA